MKYKHLFFDLDRTLWDFDKNSEETIAELFESYELREKLSADFNVFFREYIIVNDEQWAHYRIGRITKDELRLQRFHQTFRIFNYNDPVTALKFNDDYVSKCSLKSNLIPGTLEVLNYLEPRYSLHIITNGFIEAQKVKIDNSGLEKFFQEVIVSDGIGVRKPDSRIYDYAMSMAGAKAEESLMIGDDYGPDIVGARGVGMDQVYFTKEKNESEPATYSITDLIELKGIL